jgi:hypothetical protein
MPVLNLCPELLIAVYLVLFEPRPTPPTAAGLL